MLRNFLLLTFRNFKRYKYFTAINLAGLALGLTCSIFILLWITDELGYDSFHANGPRLFRVLKRDFFSEKVEVYQQGPGILVEALKAEIPEIEKGTQLSWEFQELLTVGAQSTKEPGRYVHPDFLLMFSFPLVKGDPATALNEKTSIVISERLADLYFKDEDPIGKLVRVNNKREFQVTGVIKNPPRNSSLRFDYLLHWDVFLEQNEWAKEWENNAPRAVIMLRDQAQKQAVEEKIKDFVHKRVSNPRTDVSELLLQPYRDWYLYSRFTNGQQDGGRIDYVRSFAMVAVVVLVIACINFMNLATAQSLRRSREIGIRKVNGAARKLLVIQFLGEALVFTLIGLGLALLVVELALPSFQMITDKKVDIPYADPDFVGALAAITLTTGILAGTYPAFFLSSFEVVKALKGTLKFGAGPIFLRKGMVVFQFSLTIMLIFCTLVIYRQMQYIREKNLGFDKENLIVVDFEENHRRKADVIISEATKLPGVKTVTVSTTPPLASGNSTTSVEWPGKPADKQIAITQMAVGFNYLSTMGIKLKEGRDFSPERGDSGTYIINEEAARVMGLPNPLGEVITFWDVKGPIIGVVKNYHISSFHEAIEPVILHLHPEWSNLLIVRAEAGRTEDVLKGLEGVVEGIDPAFPFSYRFVDQTFAEQYKGEATVGAIAQYFSGMAIFISCLGLLGLITFASEQRTKEIGVRKVLGASVASLFGLLAKDFLALVLLAFVIASPLAWYYMSGWLDSFAYRTSIDVIVFVISGAAAVFIALMTISYQALKTSLLNPVKSLRNE